MLWVSILLAFTSLPLYDVNKMSFFLGRHQKTMLRWPRTFQCEFLPKSPKADPVTEARWKHLSQKVLRENISHVSWGCVYERKRPLSCREVLQLLYPVRRKIFMWWRAAWSDSKFRRSRSKLWQLMAFLYYSSIAPLSQRKVQNTGMYSDPDIDRWAKDKKKWGYDSSCPHKNAPYVTKKNLYHFQFCVSLEGKICI